MHSFRVLVLFMLIVTTPCAFPAMCQIKMSAAEKAHYDTNNTANSALIISASVVPAGAVLPGIIACHTNTGCKKQTTDIME